MRRGKPTRLGSAIIAIIFAVILISGLVWAGQMILGGGSSNKTETISAGQKLMNSPTDKTAVRMSVRGPVVAKENHYSIVMTIARDSRQITTFRGYNGEVIETKTIGNTEAAFDDFMAALNRAGYMKKNNSSVSENQGICAVGQLIQFEVLDDGKSAQKLWTTSCGKVGGNFGGMVVNIEELFLNQIEDSRKIIDRAKRTVEK